MILCMDTTKVRDDMNLQKNIKLDKILLENSKYFNSVNEAQLEGYAPLNFMISVRSTYSNLVLESMNGSSKDYYINMTEVDTLPHKGYDLIMYLASIGLMQCVTYKKGFDDVMFKSQFLPIGFYNPDPSLFNPTIYSHIILPDEIVEDFKSYLKNGYRLVPIKDMERKKLSSILDSIFEINIKEESEEEESNGTYN